MTHHLVVFPNGTASVKPESLDEAMHSAIGAWEEANSLYVRQSRLAERLLAGSASALVLYDVGMGIAANALAAVECFQGLRARRDLRIVSFESELEGLDLAIAHAETRFPFLARHLPCLQALRKNRRWVSEPNELGHRARWELAEGDFRAQDLASRPVPELVFFDFYSPKANPELWTSEVFRKLRNAGGPKDPADEETLLLTYSASTAVRSAMLLAGFFVGIGKATDAKRETTLASTRLSDLEHPLDADWLAKLERSSNPLPADWGPSRAADGLQELRRHPQFGSRA